MPSRAYQGLVVFGKKKGNRGTGKLLWISAKTGYKDVWINGTHYYYNEKEIVNNIKELDMKDYFPVNNKKGVIVIQKK